MRSYEPCHQRTIPTSPPNGARALTYLKCPRVAVHDDPILPRLRGDLAGVPPHEQESGDEAGDDEAPVWAGSAPYSTPYTTHAQHYRSRSTMEREGLPLTERQVDLKGLEVSRRPDRLEDLRGNGVPSCPADVCGIDHQRCTVTVQESTYTSQRRSRTSLSGPPSCATASGRCSDCTAG